jgi:hypothetical protein
MECIDKLVTKYGHNNAMKLLKIAIFNIENYAEFFEIHNQSNIDYSEKWKYSEENKELKELIDTLKAKLDEKSIEITDLKEKVFYERQQLADKYEERVQTVRDEANNKFESIWKNFGEEIDKRVTEKNKTIESELLITKNKLREQEAELEKYRKLHSASVQKGPEFEAQFYIEMINEINDSYNNIWAINNTSTIAHKGDYYIVNKYTNIKIMIEAKHQKKVTKTEHQLNKFIANTLCKTNNYDGAIIIATKEIEGKKNFEMETQQGKVLCYLKHYKLENPKQVMSIVEMVHEKIKQMRENNTLSETVILEHQIQQYKNMISMEKQNKKESELIRETKENIKTVVLENFGRDIDKLISENKDTAKMCDNKILSDAEEFITNYLNEKVVEEKGSKIKKSYIRDAIDKIMQTKKFEFSKNKITKMINYHLKEKSIASNTNFILDCKLCLV